MKKFTILLYLIAIISLTGIGVSYAQSGTANLAYKFPPGTVTKYSITQKTTGTKQLVGSSTTTPIDVEQTTVVRIKCLQVRQDGSLDLAVDTESGTLKLAGKLSPDYQSPKDVRNIRITPSGQQVATNQSNGSNNASTLDISAIILTMVLPDKPISPNATWQTETPLPFGPDSKLRIESRLVSINTVADENVAIIKQTYTTPINPNAVSNGSTIQGSQDGNADISFATNGGYVRSAQGTLKSVLNVPAVLPASPSSNKPVKTFTAIKLDSQFTLGFLEQTRSTQ